MKRKSIKILLGVIISIVIISVSLTILIITGVIPDTRDLVCHRVDKEPTYEKKHLVLIKFGINGLVKDMEFSEELTFNTNNQAENFYNEFKNSVGEGWEEIIDINQNVITLKYEDELVDEIQTKYRKEVKSKFEEFLYECE